MARDKVIIRSYRSGDEEALVSLWEQAYASYVGFVPRSVKYWRWCILDRPGVSSQDILILQENDHILGYGVLGARGQVLELAIDSRLSKPKRERMAGILIIALEARSRARGDDVIQFMLPHLDKPISRVLRGFGYRQTPSEVFKLAIVDHAGLMKRLLHHRKGKFPKNWSPTFAFGLDSGLIHLPSQDLILIRLLPSIMVEVDPVDCSADIKVTTDYWTLVELIFQEITVEQAVVAGRLSVHPEEGKKDLGTLIGLLVIDRPWYVPAADVW